MLKIVHFFKCLLFSNSLISKFFQVSWVPLVFPFHHSSPLLLPPRTLHALWLWLLLKVPTRHCGKVPHPHTAPVKVEPPLRQTSASRGPFLQMQVLCYLLILIRFTPQYAPCLCGRLRVMTIMMMMRMELLLKSLQTNHMVQSQGHHLGETLGLSLLTAQSLTLGHPILSCQLPVPLKKMSEHQAPFTRTKNQPLQHSLQIQPTLFQWSHPFSKKTPSLWATVFCSAASAGEIQQPVQACSPTTHSASAF